MRLLFLIRNNTQQLGEENYLNYLNLGDVSIYNFGCKPSDFQPIIISAFVFIN